MNEEFLGEENLYNWLEENGFKFSKNQFVKSEENCNWYAWRRSELSARVCECNSDKDGVQIVVRPFSAQIGDRLHRNVEIDVKGEYKGIWFSISAYSLKPEEVFDRLYDIEKSLVSAWNALIV
jgi:hypothetical protein